MMTLILPEVLQEKDLTGQLLFIQILLKGYILIALLLLAALKRHFADLLIMIIGMTESDRVLLLIQKLIC